MTLFEHDPEDSDARLASFCAACSIHEFTSSSVTEREPGEARENGAATPIHSLTSSRSVCTANAARAVVAAALAADASDAIAVCTPSTSAFLRTASASASAFTLPDVQLSELSTEWCGVTLV